MQDKYACDLGDFGKYGLLRSLSSPIPGTETDRKHNPRLKLGVVWYLTPDEARTGDGRHTKYLDDSKARNQKEYRDCDPDLYDALREVLYQKKRNVKNIQESQALPDGTIFYDRPLNLKGVTRSGERTLAEVRRDMRDLWVQDSVQAMRPAEMVFLDPDNGLATAKVNPNTPRGAKYVQYSEIKTHLRRKKTVVIYHHLNRTAPARNQVYQCQTNIYKETGKRAFGMLYHRGSARVFLVIPSDQHHRLLFDRGREMTKRWKQHFEAIP